MSTCILNGLRKVRCENERISCFDRLLKIEEIEDEWLEDKAIKTQSDINSGKEKTIPWNEMKKRISK